MAGAIMFVFPTSARGRSLPLDWGKRTTAQRVRERGPARARLNARNPSAAMSKKSPGDSPGRRNETEVDDVPGLHAHVSGAFRPGIVMKKKSRPEKQHSNLIDECGAEDTLASSTSRPGQVMWFVTSKLLPSNASMTMLSSGHHGSRADVWMG